MTAILVGLGVLLALISHVGTKEPLSKEANPDIPLTRLSTLLAANFASLTSFIPSDADRKLMTRLETGLNTETTTERDCPLRKTSLVSFCGGIRWKTIRNQREEPALPKKDNVLEENFSPSNVNCAVVNNRCFFSGNIMTLNPGADSNDKNVDKVPAPINVPAVSLETKSVLLPETKGNSKPFIISRDSESALPSQTHANGTTREWLIDPRLYMDCFYLLEWYFDLCCGLCNIWPRLQKSNF